ncbi:MAG: hypothetical protein M1833_003183 [Piccolia ochrophora]|nr:MAG: hypothetical protein M1833_003183 [Piccolia ochrophora]
MASSGAELHPAQPVRRISLSYNNADSQTSALRLILTLFPDWEHDGGKVDFVRFTDGITNTLLKASVKRPDCSDIENDKEAVLLRAYGQGTAVLIDRDREFTSHSLLSRHGLAPPLLARFQNGLLYRFIRGQACKSSDLTQEPIWRGVARRLGQWHAVLPVVGDGNESAVQEGDSGGMTLLAPRDADLSGKEEELQRKIRGITPQKPNPNIWTVTQKWILALPNKTEAEKTRQATLQKELERLVTELGDIPGLGEQGLVFAHCDLLSGNVIVEPKADQGSATDGVKEVSFIDYEYATPSPAAFDVANHFAEWGGLECDYTAMPSKIQRRGFLKEYVSSYTSHSKKPPADEEATVDRLFNEVDLFRGVPGFYWGIWALIQATISQIDFDYAAYAERRLGEYWAWKGEVDGTRVKEHKDLPLRERQWARDE